MTILSHQVAAARAGLGLSREELAKRAKISAPTIMKVEHGLQGTHPAMRVALKVTLEAEGVVFLDDGGVLLPGSVLITRSRQGTTPDQD